MKNAASTMQAPHSGTGDGQGAAGESFTSQAAALVAFGERCELFESTNDGHVYADIIVNDHRETHRIDSAAFRDWLRERLYTECGKTARGEAIAQAVDTLRSCTKYGPPRPKHEVHLRSAAVESRIYLDLCDESWSAVEIDDRDWRIVATLPARFRRPAKAESLPIPESSSEGIDGLRTFFNCATENDFVLLVTWMLYVLRGKPPFPVLNPLGEQGTGKSTACRIIKRLVDPNMVSLRSLPGNEQDLLVSAQGQHVLVFDNVSTVSASLSDSLCRLADGAGFSKRRLYSDEDESTIKAARPTVLNGISDFITRGDLADRTVAVTLRPIPDAERSSDAMLWERIEKALPRLFGVLLDGLSHGLRTLPTVRESGDLPRMADFARWGIACEGAYWPVGTFERAYRSNRQDLVHAVLEADGLLEILCGWASTRRDGWEGTLSELLGHVTEAAACRSPDPSRSRSWPAAPKALAATLRRAAPALRRLGIEISVARRRGASRVTLLPPRGETP